MANVRGHLIPLLILGVFYFVFGFVTWLNGTLIPYLKIACELEGDLQANLVAFAFYISYFVMALPSAWVLRRTGFRGGMMLGLLVMAAGALLFIPAAQQRTYGLFLSGLFVIGTGLAVADRGESLNHHPGSDGKRGEAHQHHGGVQQGRGRSGTHRAGRRGASRCRPVGGEARGASGLGTERHAR